MLSMGISNHTLMDNHHVPIENSDLPKPVSQPAMFFFQMPIPGHGSPQKNLW